MKWAEALGALVDLVATDTALLAALGGVHVYRHGEHSEYRVPAIYFTVITSTIEETMEPVLTQWDIYGRGIDEVLTVETRLRKLLNWQGWRMVGGVSLSSLYEDARDHPEPDFDTVHRSLDFRHTPVRNRGW